MRMCFIPLSILNFKQQKMNNKALLTQTLILFMLIIGASENAFTQDKNVVVRIAKLQIDSAQLDNYKEALKEEIEASVRFEAGVLTLYAVADKKKYHTYNRF
jgi:hypothetical protein